MTDPNDNIDDLIRKSAKAADRTVPAHLLSRVLADATAHQPRTGLPAPSWLRSLFDGFGGWQGAAAMAASLALGIGLGAGGSETGLDLLDLSGLRTIADAEALDSFGIGEFDLGALEF